jgi:hypothetical protein
MVAMTVNKTPRRMRIIYGNVIWNNEETETKQKEFSHWLAGAGGSL